MQFEQEQVGSLNNPYVRSCGTDRCSISHRFLLPRSRGKQDVAFDRADRGGKNDADQPGYWIVRRAFVKRGGQSIIIGRFRQGSRLLDAPINKQVHVAGGAHHTTRRQREAADQRVGDAELVKCRDDFLKRLCERWPHL